MKDRPTGLPASTPVEWTSDIAAELLRRLGVDYISLNPGASYRGFHDSLVNYLGNTAPSLLLCLHEDHAVSVAHGYAKATDRAMACALHSNVGLMHGLMGIYNAWCDRAPMIVIGATGPAVTESRRPWIDWIHTAKDQGALLRNFTKWDDEPRSAQGLIEALLRGAQIARTAPRAPVYICLDAALQEERADDSITIPPVDRFQPAADIEAPAALVADTAAAIRNARQPIFLFGRGSLTNDAWQNRIRLAESTGAHVFTSRRERSIFPTDHPAHISDPLGPLTQQGRDMLAGADLIVSFDWVDLDTLLRQVHPATAGFPGRIIHASLDSVLHNGWSMDQFGPVPADLRVMANPDSLVAQLLDAMTDANVSTDSFQHGEAAVALAPLPAYSDASDREIAALDVEIALAETRGSRDDFTLAQVNLGWTASIYRYRHPLDFLGHNGGAGLAAGTGLTVGAALALKDAKRVIIGVLGDGDFLQGVTALWTAAHYEIPALFLIVNNRSNFNDERHQESVAKTRGRPVENRWIGQRIDDPPVDIAAMSRAQGVDAEGPVGTVPDLLDALNRGVAAVTEGRPYLIDVHVVPGYAAMAPADRKQKQRA